MDEGARGAPDRLRSPLGPGGPRVVLSLDFELRWGVYDVFGDDARAYARNLEGVADVVPLLLEELARRGMGATWATVGALACEDWDEWRARAPAPPSYTDRALRWRDSYRALDPTGRLHFAPRLVGAIVRTPGQELASHTFGHVFLREPGLTRADAEADTDALHRVFQDRWGLRPTSIVFPRNQIAFTDVLSERGIAMWRDNPRAFYWRSTAAAEQTALTRALRLADAVLPLGRRAAPAAARRASYFVRINLPRALWRLHAGRMLREARALRPGEVLHLWLHPHNLGARPRASVERLLGLLDAIGEASPSASFVPMRELSAG